LQNVKHNLKGVLCVFVFLLLCSSFRYAVTRDENDKKGAIRWLTGSAIQIVALILARFKLKLLHFMIVILYIVTVGSLY
jgi:hypothetical protein